MTKLLEFWRSAWGHVTLAGLVLATGAVVGVQQRSAQMPAPVPPVAVTQAAPLPKEFPRAGKRLEVPKPEPKPVEPPKAEPLVPPAPKRAPLLSRSVGVPKREAKVSAPTGRLIPCRTVLALESSRLETPIVGIVAEDVWHAGRLVVPGGAEVHGRASLDRSRERIAGGRQWTVVWRTRDAENGTELKLEGIALDRADDADLDGAAGLRGEIVRTDDDRKLFAAAFLGNAATALQETRSVGGVFGESALPAVSARNAGLAGVSAVLAERVRELREAIARDGVWVRVPAGKAFYLYVTQPIERRVPESTPSQP